MSTTQLSPKELVIAAGQLEPPEFERFLAQLLTLRGERKELREEQLLEQVYREVLPEFRERYEELSKKLHQETLTDKEQKELTRYTDAMETRSVERLQALIQLARLRKTTLDALMKDLGLGRRSHA